MTPRIPKSKLITIGADVVGLTYDYFQIILQYEGFAFEEIVIDADPTPATVRGYAVLLKGQCNPAGFTFAMIGDQILREPYDLINWMKERGLRRC